MQLWCETVTALELDLLCCRLGGGTLGHTQWGQQVWRFPLSARSAVAEALEAAVGVRCTVEDVHPVPRAYLEVGPVPCAAAVLMNSLILPAEVTSVFSSSPWRL